MKYKRMLFFTWIFVYLCINMSASLMNLSKGKPAIQSSDHNSGWTADRAVDGVILSQDVGCYCCSHTAHRQQTAWWQVDLTALSNIRRIKIMYRKGYYGRLAGFSVYVTNSSRSPDVLCYRDPISDTLPNTTQDLQCDYTARYVYVYNERLSNKTYPQNYSKEALLELCEVEVYGCPLGTYGEDCGSNCSNKCRNESYLCDPDTGNCASGCKTSWLMGPHCDNCGSGLYGTNCSKRCPVRCLDSVCDRNNGVCLGCGEGYTGNQCDVCVRSRYGQRCEKYCSTNCFDDTCDNYSGDCTYGCEAHFNGSRCEECIHGRYGTFCQHNCSNYCNGMHCQRLTGECLHGCRAGWSGESCNEPVPLAEGSSVQAPEIAGIVIVIILILLLVVLLVVLLLMKRRSVGIFKTSNHQHQTNNILKPEDITIISQNNSNSNKSEDTSFIHANPPTAHCNGNDILVNTTEDYYNMDPWIPIKGIAQHMAQKTKHDFENEYKKFPDGPKFPLIHASKPENKLKNRFQKSYCYDHSRVILAPLPNKPASDYINANYINQLDVQKCYIATQGPMVNTVNDFWRMVWEEHSSVIVMLTNLVELGKVKSEKYWPEIGQILEAGQFSIAIESVQEFFSFCFRKTLITNSNDEKCREILQFHFNSWPDHGTPDRTELLLFQRKIAAQYKEATGPLIVHCSAGIGRTGTFIALDALSEIGNRTGMVNIPDCVEAMRKDRVNMIQALEQYIFLNEVLVEAFEFEDTYVTRQSINDLFENQMSNTEAGGNVYPETLYLPKVQKEFQSLISKKILYTDKDYTAALEKDNRNKNKDNFPLALDLYRPFVNIRLLDETDYLNAVILPAYNGNDRYIVSHTPLQNTDVNLWSVIVDNMCETLIVFDVDDSEKTSRWLPLEEKEIEMGTFTIKKEVEENAKNANVKICTLCVSEKDSTTDLKIKAYILSSWTNEELISSKQQLVKLIRLVDDWLQSRDPGILTVLCPDGVTECGIFSVVHDVIGSLRTNGEADIYQAVRRIQCRRPECISSGEQYQFCYEALKEYSDHENIHAQN